MDVNTTTADSSSVTAEVPRAPEAYSEWRKTGQLPAAKQDSSKEASTPSDTSAAADDAAGNTAPASEAGTEKQERTKQPRNAETRLNELLADLKKAGLSPAELKTYKKQAEKAAAEAQTEPPPTPPEKTENPAGPKAPVKPKVEDFDSYETFEAAKDTYYEELADYRAELKFHQRDQQAKAAAQQKEVDSMLEQARGRYGEAADTTIGEAAKAVFDDAKIPSAVKALINDSEVMVDLLYTLGSKAEDIAGFVALAKSNPGAAIRKVVLLERLVSEELGQGGQAEPGRDESGKFTSTSKETPAKKVTQAPPPPREASGRSAAPRDATESAVKANDFASFRATQNRRDLTRQ
jgi:hypothetical protein